MPRDFIDIAQLTKDMAAEGYMKRDQFDPETVSHRVMLAIAQQLAVMNSHLAKIERALSGKRK